MFWTQSTTKDYIRAEHKLHSISKLFISQVILPQVTVFEPIYIPQGTQHGNLASSRVTTSVNQQLIMERKKTQERFWKKIQVNGPERSKLARKKSLAVSVACTAIYNWPTPSFKGRTFKFCVLCSQQMGLQFRRPQLPTAGERRVVLRNEGIVGGQSPRMMRWGRARGRGRLYIPHATLSPPEWFKIGSGVWAVLEFHYECLWRAKSQDVQRPESTTFWRERRAEVESNRDPFDHQHIAPYPQTKPAHATLSI